MAGPSQRLHLHRSARACYRAQSPFLSQHGSSTAPLSTQYASFSRVCPQVLLVAKDTSIDPSLEFDPILSQSALKKKKKKPSCSFSLGSIGESKWKVYIVWFFVCLPFLFFFVLSVIQEVSARLLPQEAITVQERRDHPGRAARQRGDFRLINQRLDCQTVKKVEWAPCRRMIGELTVAHGPISVKSQSS